MQPDNNKVITRKDIDNLERIISFGDPEAAIGSIGVAITNNNKRTSNSKHLTQGGIVTERTTRDDGLTSTVTYRLQTEQELKYNLNRILREF